MSVLPKKPDTSENAAVAEGLPEPTGGPTGEAAELSKEARERERWTRARRRENLLWTGVMVCFLLLTLYFVGLNVWVILKSRLLPYRLQIQHTLQEGEAAVYRASVKWNPVAEGETTPVRPRLLFGDTPIPVFTDGDAGLEIDLNSDYRVSISLPENVTSIPHVGELVFVNRSGDEELPQQKTIPVAIEITDSWWRNWWVVRDWLIFLLIIYAVAYLACCFLYPKPQGVLVVMGPDGGWGAPRRNVPLKSPPISLLFPWKRSEIPLRWLWRKNHIGSSMATTGEIVFRDANLSPYLVLYRKHGSCFLKRPASTEVGEDEDPDQMTEIVSSDTLLPGRIFAYCRHPGKIDVVFEYRKKKFIQ